MLGEKDLGVALTPTDITPAVKTHAETTEDRQVGLLSREGDLDAIVFLLGLPFTVPELVVSSFVRKIRGMRWRRHS